MRFIESATLREFRNGTDAQQLVVLTGMSVGAGFGGIHSFKRQQPVMSDSVFTPQQILVWRAGSATRAFVSYAGQPQCFNQVSVS